MTRVTIAIGAAGVALFAFTLALPPGSVHTPSVRWQPHGSVIAGAIHIHTSRSDGSGSIDDVATAARRAGLRFVIITDHGDGTRPPDPPVYREGVLCIDSVEISTSRGHYVAIGLPQAPYPLAGEPRDVAEDVARLGGFGIVAHGDSTKRDLLWQDWDLPFDGIEWLNLDSQWRSESPFQIGRALAAYWVRKPEALASLAARPASLLNRWDELTRSRRIVAFGATDAHAPSLWGDHGSALRFAMPSYEACLRTLSTQVELERPLSGDADLDARLVLEALRAGHHYTGIDALASPPKFEFRGRIGDRFVSQGDVVDTDAPVALDARVAAPSGTLLVLLQNGVPIAETHASSLSYVTPPRKAVYRIEARIQDTSGNLPWIVSNPIYVGRWSDPTLEPDLRSRSNTRDLMTPMNEGDAWHLELDARSQGSVEQATGSLVLRYALAAGAPADQMVGAVRSLPSELAAYHRIALRARASRPLRLVVQFRAQGEHNPPRWRRSIYLDRTSRDVAIRFAEMHGVDDAPDPLSLSSIGALMLLVDANNTMPGTSGEIVVSVLALEP